MAASEKKRIIWFGMKVTPEQKRKIKHLASFRGVSQEEAVLELIDRALDEEGMVAEHGSFYQKFKDHIGNLEGPSDLSTNPKYFKDFGR